MMKRIFLLLTVAAASSACERSALDDACQAALMEGDLVITEIQANPLGNDSDREFIELFNNTGSAVDLAGVTLVSSRADETGERFHRMGSISIDAGDYIVLGNADKDLLHPFLDYGYGGDLGGLRNSEARVAVFCAGVLVDQMSYGETTNGQSVQLDGSQAPSAANNDLLSNLCNSSTEGNAYETDNYGTPGAPNGTCDNVITNPCEGITEGDLVITEVMADFDGERDTGNEFFEIYNASSAELDLTGVTITSARADGTSPKNHAIVEGTVATNDYWVLSNATEPLPDYADYSYGTSLGDFRNDAGGRIELTCGSISIDVLVFGDATKGRAIQLGGPDAPSATANDLPENLCDVPESAGEYVAANFGTPGEPNADCGALPTACDGFSEGDLVVTEVMADSAGSDTGNEFIEVYNPTSASIELSGLSVRSSNLDVEQTVRGTHEISTGTIPSGGYWVLSSSTGDLPSFADYAYGSSLGTLLNDAGGRIELLCDTLLIDELVFGDATQGQSIQLDGAMAPSHEINDNPANFCDTPITPASEYTTMPSNYGTPGEMNLACL